MTFKSKTKTISWTFIKINLLSSKKIKVYSSPGIKIKSLNLEVGSKSTMAPWPTFNRVICHQIWPLPCPMESRKIIKLLRSTLHKKISLELPKIKYNKKVLPKKLSASSDPQNHPTTSRNPNIMKIKKNHSQSMNKKPPTKCFKLQVPMNLATSKTPLTQTNPSRMNCSKFRSHHLPLGEMICW